MTPSWMGTQTILLITSEVEREAGGIVKEPIDVSIIIPCSANSVGIRAAEKTIPAAQIGNMRIKIFNSCTCVTVQSYHGSEKSPLCKLCSLEYSSFIKTPAVNYIIAKQAMIENV
ncbi:hypothetical protein SLA2020_026850 [Shorea laevis]